MKFIIIISSLHFTIANLQDFFTQCRKGGGAYLLTWTGVKKEEKEELTS